VSKNSIFSELAPFAVGTNAPTSVCGWPILAQEPAVGKLSTSSHKCWQYNYSNLTFSLSRIALPQEEINRFVAQLFDQDPATARPADLPLPYSSKNPPPSVRATLFCDHYSICN
jgi:hypothetical protein